MIKNNFKIVFCLWLIILMPVLTIAKNKDALFSSMNIKEARQKASVEGKLIFLDFHAKWCSPCTWMEKTTFTDEGVIKILQEDFIALQIDIDHKDGYEIKNQYDVKYLPTILIFNSEGIMVERIEKTVTPRTLKELLSRHNEPDNKKIVKHTYNSSPTNNKPEMSDSVPYPQEMSLTKDEEKEYFSEPLNKKIFKLQLGVFEKYELADAFVQKLNDTFLEPVTVKNEMKNGKMIFRVFLGQFETQEEAEVFKKQIFDENQLDSIVN
jgi:thiol-disulfide isomerase/thioredoxin